MGFFVLFCLWPQKAGLEGCMSYGMIWRYIIKISDTVILTMEEWAVKVMQLAEMATLTVLIKENNLCSFVSIWKPLLDSLLKTEN